MKRYIIPFIAAAAVLLAGCNEIENAVQPVVVPDGEMIVNLAVDGPMGDPAVRSYVEGKENDISTIDLLCFDNEGKFITERVATLTPDETTPATKGRLNATVPANTCRIHFVANYNGLDLSGFGMGSLERTMMKSEALSSGITDEVRFWGYHSEASAGAMKTWLSAGTNKVWLLRDRAKVVLKNEDSNIKELAWTIGNGCSRGFVAPLCVSGNNPYANSYVTSTRLTEYADAKYATMTDTDDDAIWAAADEPQFLFENGNTQGDPVKVIIRAKYADDADPVYHTVLLQDNTNKTYPVKRNETFTLTVKNLPESVGKGSLVAALATTDYSNNPYAQVAREVDEVNSEQFTLRVEKVVKMYNQEDVVTIDGVSYGLLKFYYTAHDSGSLQEEGITKDNFDLSWEAKSSDDKTDEVVAEIESGEQQGELKAAVVADYSASTGEGIIRIPLATLTTDLKHSSLQIIAKNSGLSRFADLYSITAFAYGVNPDLEYNNSTRPVGGSSREVYKLTFTLPENYPAGLYPVHVKLYTSTLVPFSDDKNNATTASGSFDVVVADTKDLEQSAQTADWNYGAQSWNQYYDYVIPSPSSSSNREYTIYLYDITGNFSRNIDNVGLYFQIDGFGDPKSLSANLPYKTVTFVTNNQSRNFPSQNSKTIDDITLTFATNAIQGRTNGYLELNNNRTFTISSSAGNITSITINYTDYDHGRSGYGGYYYSSSNPATNSGYVYATNNGTTGTWRGSSKSITFTMIGSDYYYTRIASIVVKYK